MRRSVRRHGFVLYIQHYCGGMLNRHCYFCFCPMGTGTRSSGIETKASAHPFRNCHPLRLFLYRPGSQRQMSDDTMLLHDRLRRSHHPNRLLLHRTQATLSKRHHRRNHTYLWVHPVPLEDLTDHFSSRRERDPQVPLNSPGSLS